MRTWMLPAMAIALLSVSAYGEGDLIIKGQSLVLVGEHEFHTVRITNGGALNIGFDRTARDVLVLKCHEFLLDASSQIDGLRENSLGGNDGPMPDGRGGAGGAYGGHGAAPEPGAVKPPFGTMRGLDITEGRVGTRGSPAYSLRGEWIIGGYGGGGGAGINIVADIVKIDGWINMGGRYGDDSEDCPIWDDCPDANAGGGGGGGGILIMAKFLTISDKARLSANGGDGGKGVTYDKFGFGGGGGRIKIFFEQGNIAENAVLDVSPGESLAKLDQYRPCPDCVDAEPGSIWIQQVPSIDQLLNPKADLNNDGIVDQSDLLLLLEQWHQTEPTPAPTAEQTPEGAP